MQNVEIERKFTLKQVPENLDSYKHSEIEQAYLCTKPVVRIRRIDDKYILTYKNGGGIAHTEYDLPLSKEGYEHLLTKADGNIISKTRYFIPLDENHTVELDVFHGVWDGLVFAEVEFESLDDATSFELPDWFDEDVTSDRRYHNSYLAMNDK